jgi:beta-galactosidase
MMTRREWLGTVAAGAAASGALLPAESAAEPAVTSRRLADNWEYYRGSLGGIWEVWRGKAAAANVIWTQVSIPHCFNAFDTVDPDRPYYQGHGWYRTEFPLENPFPNGRTLLHCEGAGQKYEVFIGLESVGRHVGGYDEWTVDITDAAARAKDSLQLAVLCDNSRDQQMIPSDQSDFNRYGGLYRHVNLVYVPALSLERVLIETSGEPDRARVSIILISCREISRSRP